MLFPVVVRSYIAGIRDQLKEYKARVEHGGDDAHAHYHGHELCTSDHGEIGLVLHCTHYFYRKLT